MYCKFCGREVDEKAELCVHCGRRIRSSVSTFLETSEFTRLKRQREPKSPGLAAFLGFVLSWMFMGPIGYIYLGQWNWFFAGILVYGITLLISLGTGYFVFPFLFAFHQYQMAQDLNQMLSSTLRPAGESSSAQPGGTPDQI
jgi:hypothetical protein